MKPWPKNAGNFTNRFGHNFMGFYKYLTNKEAERELEADAKPLDGVDCPNCGHAVAEPINDIWKDPNVMAALKDGRDANDIAVVACPKCGKWGYYNQGSHFSCRFCNRTWSVLTEDEDNPYGGGGMYLDGHTTLADTVTETTDGYDNRTLP